MLTGPALPPYPNGTVVTVGAFDGVHRGHWAVLQRVRAHALESGRRSVLVTFDPHPLRVVRPEAAQPLLTTLREKKEILAESGLGIAVILAFTPELSQYSPERFVDEVLIGRLGMAQLVIGFDHGLGRGRSGDPETLRRLGALRGFDVEVVPATQVDGDIVSSSSVRRALMAGDVERAAAGLGRPYSLRGRVIRGDGRGRELGFPTANIHVAEPDKLIPHAGIYAVRVAIRGDHRVPPQAPARFGVLHLGPRPVFPGATPTIEVHVLDFDGDLYGREVHVEFCSRIRDVEAFSGVSELVRAIERDCATARELFAGGGGACCAAPHPLP
ncbi:MAG TPA: bifunctional riboflavin kinase/FAD synthetase [Longimicrobiales bacterium]|nr:bifunctional riboflavin kinase/FAD synthetase [Longimicrobiales bacterium]